MSPACIPAAHFSQAVWPSCRRARTFVRLEQVCSINRHADMSGSQPIKFTDYTRYASHFSSLTYDFISISVNHRYCKTIVFSMFLRKITFLRKYK